MPTVNIARERSLYTSFSDRAREMRQLELARLQEQLGTEQRVNRASDDPSAFSLGHKLGVLDSQYNQYLSSIGNARAWVSHTEAALGQLAEFFTEAQERGIRIANGTASDSDRETFAQRLEYILQTVPDQLNAKYGDEYLFAGSDTLTKPFVSEAPTSATDSGIHYKGNTLSRTRRIGPDTDYGINTTGAEVQNVDADGDGTTDYTIMDALKSLIDSVRANDAPGIQSALGKVQASRDHLLDLGSAAGNRINRLDMAEAQIKDAQTLIGDRRSEYEDADLARTLIDVQRQQTALQAAMQVTGSLLQTSLLDYLR